MRRSGGGATLQQAASAALGIDASSGQVDWDSWRREDGKWVVSAGYPDRGATKVARWTYDPAGRNIHPLDDNARALMGVRTLDEGRDPIADALDLVSVEDAPGDSQRPRLVAVPDSDARPEAAASTPDDQAAGTSSTAATVTIAHPSTTPAAPPAATPPAAAPAARKTKARKGRASVPSWDEILFGATRPEDKS